MNVQRAVLVVFLGLFTGACGGGNASQQTGGGGASSGGGGGTVDQNPVFQTGDRVVSAELGQPGGTLSLGNGARAEFPAGAVGETVEVHFSTEAQTQAFNNRDYEKPVGPTLQLQPGIRLASGTVAISIPATSIPSGFTDEQLMLAVEIPADVQRSSVMGSTQTTWTYIAARSESGRFMADMPDAVPGMRLQFIVSEE
jgi:hypothetical protein